MRNKCGGRPQKLEGGQTGRTTLELPPPLDGVAVAPAVAPGDDEHLDAQEGAEGDLGEFRFHPNPPKDWGTVGEFEYIIAQY